LPSLRPRLSPRSPALRRPRTSIITSSRYRGRPASATPAAPTSSRPSARAARAPASSSTAYGANPEDCGGGGYVSGAALKLTDGVYPDEGLARYEYRKHGTCSGLDPQAYFAAVKTLRDAIVVPDALKAPREAQTVSPDALTQAFIAANANLAVDNMAVTCRDGELIDVRICIAKSLTAFAQCPKVSGHTCHAASITVAPLR